MKYFIVLFLLAGCQQNRNIPLEELSLRDFKKLAITEVDRMSSYEVTANESLDSLIGKAYELSKCDSIVVLCSQKDSESAVIGITLKEEIQSIRMKCGNALRINYGVCLAHSLSKEYGYETFANFGLGEDGSKYLILRSDGFDKQIALSIYKKIYAPLKLFEFVQIVFSSKSQYFDRGHHYKDWVYSHYGIFDISQPIVKTKEE